MQPTAQEKHWPTVDRERTIALLRDLIRIRTVNPPGNETEAALRLVREFEGESLECRLQEVAPARANLIVSVGDGGGPHLWLNAHLDTVSEGDAATWTRNPFGAEEVDGRIYGRGATDDKGGIAAMAGAMLAVARSGVRLRGTASFTAVVGEETGNIGTRHLIASGFEADMAIVGEYTSASRIAAGYRGCLWLRLTTRGRGAHGSRPNEGVNAVYHMTDIVLPAIRNLSLPHEPAPDFLVRKPTISVNRVVGGEAVNVIPDRCSAEVDIRLVPGQASSAVLQQIRELLDQCRRQHPELQVEIEVLQASEPFWTDPDSELVQGVGRCIARQLGTPPSLFGKSGTSDGNVIAASLGIPVIAYGPGNSSGHGPDEYVETEDVLAAAGVLAASIVELCGAET